MFTSTRAETEARAAGGGVGRAQFHSADEKALDHSFAAEVGPVDLVIDLTGVSAGTRTLQIDAAHLNLEMVPGNRVMFGTVNANRRHKR